MKKKYRLLLCTGLLTAMGTVQAAPVQILLAEDFQSVSGINAANDIRTIAEIVMNSPTELSGNPTTTISLAGNAQADAAAFNVRQGNNTIDGNSGSPTLGNGNFDNFFGPASNQFAVIGDNAGGLGGAPNGGTGGNSSATMTLSFGLASITLQDPQRLNISFDFVFDANNVSNPDDLFVNLALADNSLVSLLSITGGPTVASRGTYSNTIDFANLAAAPSFLSFTLVEKGGNGSSAVGLDNLNVTAIPEPGTLALLGLGLLGMSALRKRVIAKV